MKIGKINISAGFFLLFAWLNYLDEQFIVAQVLLACALHELGHYGLLRLLGGDIKELNLTAIGAEMVPERALNYWQEGLVALAGPATNILLAFLASGFAGGRVFAGLNLSLGCLNLLPLSQLDGGRVLSSIATLLFSPACALRVSRGLDCMLTIGLVLGGLFLFYQMRNLTLLLVSAWAVCTLLRQSSRIGYSFKPID